MPSMASPMTSPVIRFSAMQLAMWAWWCCTWMTLLHSIWEATHEE